MTFILIAVFHQEAVSNVKDLLESFDFDTKTGVMK